jgi:hypothetical protein
VQNQAEKRGQYLGVDFLHFGNRSDFSPKKKPITSTRSARPSEKKERDLLYLLTQDDASEDDRCQVKKDDQCLVGRTAQAKSGN